MYFCHPVNDTYSIYDRFYSGKSEKYTQILHWLLAKFSKLKESDRH